jgi:hypothetical protein
LSPLRNGRTAEDGFKGYMFKEKKTKTKRKEKGLIENNYRKLKNK